MASAIPSSSVQNYWNIIIIVSSVKTFLVPMEVVGDFFRLCCVILNLGKKKKQF